MTIRHIHPTPNTKHATPTMPHTPQSLRVLLQHIIDYAGLFPPARLPLDEAIAHYARYRQGPDAWMLSRFIIPTRRMAELTEAQLAADEPFVFSALGRGGEDRAEFLFGIEEDARDVAAFRAGHDGRVVVDMFEVRWPSALLALGDVQALARLPAEMRDRLGEMRLFLETPWEPRWDDWVPLAVDALARDGRAGFKLRCGGVDASMFPSVSQVAAVILACRDAGVPLKCTAGLHHPLRHFNPSVNAYMHGFFNVFGGGVLAHVHGLTQADLE
ncbi:MAG: hypothetical protein GXP42_18215, partial [Chloroflexi bacterium]|nr:hypothetical protein [Chloroflexota bacterium]